jgi:hypothetical protein
MAELPNLEQAVQQLRNRAARQRRNDSPQRAAERVAFVEAATADAERLSALSATERGLAEWSLEDLLRPPTDGA